MLPVKWYFVQNLLQLKNAKFYMYTLYVQNFKLNFIFNLSLGRAFYDHSDVSYASLSVKN